jgi:hypothetical protein
MQIVLDSNTSSIDVVDSMECNAKNYKNLNHGHIDSHSEPAIKDIQHSLKSHVILNKGCKHPHHMKLRSGKHIINFFNNTCSIQNIIDEIENKSRGI